MNDLEKHILECVKEEMPSIRKMIKEKYSDGKTKEFKVPFWCDCVNDWIVYNIETDKFTKIYYSVGRGECSLSTSINSGFFNDTEYKELTLQ